jgi:hypothetical protein
MKPAADGGRGSTVLAVSISVLFSMSSLFAGCGRTESSPSTHIPPEDTPTASTLSTEDVGSRSDPPNATDNSSSSADPQPRRAALSRAHDLLLRASEGAEFQTAVNDASPYFEPISVESGKNPVKWTRITLNKSGAMFDAVRLRSTSREPACLVLAFAGPEDLGILSWQIVASQGESPEFDLYFFRNDVFLDDVDLPAQNGVVLQQLSQPQFKPDVDYYLEFITGPVGGRWLGSTRGTAVDATIAFPYHDWRCDRSSGTQRYNLVGTAIRPTRPGDVRHSGDDGCKTEWGIYG